MKQPLPLNERLKTAGQLVTLARIFFDIWHFFDQCQGNREILKTLNDYSEFFRFETHAHLVAFVVHIAALFETRKDTINFPSLVKEVQLPTETFSTAKALLASAKPLTNKVGILRNYLFAHRAASLSYEAAFKAASISRDDMRELTDIGLDIANLLLKAQRLEERSFHPLSVQDAAAIMRKLGAPIPSAWEIN